MATLTASGINCSDGTLDGVYTGTNTGYTTYPIGTYLMCYSITGVSTLYNSTGSVNRAVTPYGYTSTGNSANIFNIYGNSTPGYSALAGTWRARGSANGYNACNAIVYGVLIQRVA